MKNKKLTTVQKFNKYKKNKINILDISLSEKEFNFEDLIKEKELSGSTENLSSPFYFY